MSPLLGRTDHAARTLPIASSSTVLAHTKVLMRDHRGPLAVVLAERAQDVSAVVRLAAASRLPIVPRGAGTGLSGGANALAGSIVLSLERMTRIVEVNADERYVVAEAGVINDTLREVVAGHGLWYPPDPASYRISTIGGNVATNAGGTWHQLTLPSTFPNRFVQGLSIDPTNSMHAYAAINGFSRRFTEGPGAGVGHVPHGPGLWLARSKQRPSGRRGDGRYRLA